jgi:hypothetical protein
MSLFSLLIFVPCWVISSIDFASSIDFSIVVSGVADGSLAVVVLDAFAVLTSVRGTGLSGITSMGVSYSFSFTNLSISTSISFIYAFCSMINFNISSFSPSVSTISLACESFVGGIFSCFLRDSMPTFFFLSISLANFTFKGSYPILRTNSSIDLILLSFAKDDIFSSFN